MWQREDKKVYTIPFFKSYILLLLHNKLQALSRL